MTKLARPKRTKQAWQELEALGPEPVEISDQDEHKRVRQAFDRWSEERLFAIKNLGSLMEIKRVTRRQVPVACLHYLIVRRKSKVVVEPYKGERWRQQPVREVAPAIPSSPTRRTSSSC